jgi:hypothetical protein
MKNYFFLRPKTIIPFWTCYLVLMTVFLCGSCLQMGGCIPLVEHKREVHLSAPMSQGSSFATQTHNGSITITGAGVTDCNLTTTIIARVGPTSIFCPLDPNTACNLVATITARADNEEKAKKLAEEVKIKLEPSGNKLIAKIEKPPLVPRRYVSVDFVITVPDKTSLDLTTHNGQIEITNITGQVKGITHNGEVSAKKVSGPINLQTHNGNVDCQNITGDMTLGTHNGNILCAEVSGNTQLRTHNGQIDAFYSKAAPPVCNVSIVTHNGDAKLTTPLNFSAKVNASTHNGSINTDLPITVTGKMNKGELTGTIGTGEGNLHVETHNGSINIK